MQAMNEEHRSHILLRGPVGRWQSALGTAAGLTGDRIEFHDGGRGVLHSWSPAFGQEALPFEWRMQAPGHLLVRQIYDDGDDEVEAWTELELEFRERASDLGAQMVLAEKGAEGFWLMLDPLAWVGPPQ